MITSLWPHLYLAWVVKLFVHYDIMTQNGISLCMGQNEDSVLFPAPYSPCFPALTLRVRAPTCDSVTRTPGPALHYQAGIPTNNTFKIEQIVLCRNLEL